MYPLRYKIATAISLIAASIILLCFIYRGFSRLEFNHIFLYQVIPSVFILSGIAVITAPLIFGRSGHWIIFFVSALVISILSLGTGRYIYNLQSVVLLGVCISVHIFYKNKINILEKKVAETEKMKEAANLLKAERIKTERLNAALLDRFKRYSSLRKIGESFSARLSMDEICQLAVKVAYSLIPNTDTALLFIVDETRQRLQLLASKTATELPRIKSKNGDIFDHWVFKERQTLSVTNVNEDFRFDYKPISGERHFLSLISTPLISQSRITGILRLNSSKKDAYTIDELRLLDFVSDIISSAINNARLYRTTEELSIRDSLTGFYNHRYLKQRIDEEIKRADITGTPLSVIMIDIDHFKDYNDRYGHIGGDKVLMNIANIIRYSTAKSHIIGRYGGEEFAILLPNADQEIAAAAAEKIRQGIASFKFMLRRKETSVTISAGVVSYVGKIEKEELLKQADFCLYRAKREGRNRICVA